MSTQVKQRSLSPEMKLAGWKLEEKIVNDDTENPRFVAVNQKLAIGTGEYGDIDEAIDVAEFLHKRHEGKKAKVPEHETAEQIELRIEAEERAAIESDGAPPEEEAIREESDEEAKTRIREEAGGHEWRKSCLVTQRGGFDTYRCELCGATAKRYGVSWPPAPDKKQPLMCPALAKEEADAEANRIIEEAKQSPAAARTEALSAPPPPRVPAPTVTALLAVDSIDPEVALQMRAEGLNMLKVAEYKEAMVGGAEFPPVDVFHDFETGEQHLGGGAHRHAAATAAGLEIRANVHDGTKRDALIFAAGENRTHGLPRTNADKRLAVEALLRDGEWVTEADSVIAEHAGVSQPFVSTLRAALETQNIISPQSKRRGKDRVVRDVTKIGGGHAEPETADVDDRQTTLADIGVALPPRDGSTEAELSVPPSERVCRICFCTEDNACEGGCSWVEEDLCSRCQPAAIEASAGDAYQEKTSRPDWEQVPGEIVACLNRHGGVLMRLQLEEMGFSYPAILNAVSEGVIAQPETGKFTLPDHKPQPEANGKRQTAGATATPAKPKPSIEELVSASSGAAMLSVAFTWIPAMKGKVGVSVNATTDKAKAMRKVIDSEEIRGFSSPVMKMIFDHLAEVPPKAKSGARVVKGAKKAATKSTKNPAKKAPSKKPAKKAAAKKKARKR